MCKFEGCNGKVSRVGLCAAHYEQFRKTGSMKPLQTQFHGLSELDRFFKWTEKGKAGDCWLWKGSRIQAGWHGQWRASDGSIELAHRAAWRMMKSDIPDGLCVLHRCDNPICVNPTHLWLGSRADNMHDMWAKGRARPATSRGEKHGNAKLTSDLVRDIRKSSEADSELAARLNLSRVTIYDVRKRKTWKHIV